MRAVCVSATFPCPPISKTKEPPGLSAEKADWRTSILVDGLRKIQWSAAFENTLSYFPVGNCSFVVGEKDVTS